MKKSMLTLVGCALAAGTVMAAEVAGNNTAVVIQKEPVVSSNLYQFLIVPVKGFDITGAKSGEPLTLNEILPPAVYAAGTSVYDATATTNVELFTLTAGAWSGSEGSTGTTTFPQGAILWLKTPSATAPATVFCGELADDGVAVDLEDKSGFVPFGNATSEAVAYSDITVTEGFKKSDKIYILEQGKSSYYILNYNGTNWTKRDTESSGYIPVTADDKLPAGAAAYYYRK